MTCKNCKTTIAGLNYCPNCGMPLNKDAIELENTKVQNIRLETLLKISQLVEDEKTLLLINELITKIKNK